MLTVIELGLRYYISDLHSEFEEDRTKTAVASVDDRYFEQTGRQTDRHVHSSDFTSAQCHVMM